VQRSEIAEWLRTNYKDPHSSFLDWRKVVNNPEIMQELARQMYCYGTIPRGSRVLVGIADNGINIAKAIARCGELPSVIIDIRAGEIEGVLPILRGICLVDDRTRTGETINRARRVLTANYPGAIILSESVICLDRSDPRGVRALFEKKELTL